MKLGKIKIPTKSETASEVRKAIADNEAVDSVIEGKQPADTRPADKESVKNIKGHKKLSRLVEGDFPFDDSQREAIDGLADEQYGCLTGAAGTGKTTVTKAIADRIVQGNVFDEVDMETYFKKGEPEDPEDSDDRTPDEKPRWVPSIAMCAFTGRASQMIKKNFPRDWHSNIMTIHRMLGYVPERYEDYDPESGSMRTKMRFVPTYTKDLQMPWDLIIIDEAGMLSTDLWENLWAACKPGCRIIMIGDINQLPPVHGKSVFGFAMAKWPTWELTKVHRQKGKDNPIVDNAWRVIHGKLPESGGRFQMIELKGGAELASRKVRGIIPALKDRKVYDPIRDCIITPVNGEEGARGYALGQLVLNREFAQIFNSDDSRPRYIIDGGREQKKFAVGDKVMATKNDWQAGITNGMTGVITQIQRNDDYAGDSTRFGTVKEVNDYLSMNPTEELEDDFTIDFEELEQDFDTIHSGLQDAKEKRERGPASHTVTVRFGSEEHGIEMPFASLSEVGTLMTAYAVTCHKMQGGEAPVVIIICHDSHKSMMYREWLYTAITRASQKCILLYTPTALRVALNKQNIKGHTLREKVASFNRIVGQTAVTLPESPSTGNRVMDREVEVFSTPARLQTAAVKKGGLAQLLKKAKAKEEAKTESTIHVKVTVEHRTTTTPAQPPKSVEPVDGGEIRPESKAVAALPAPKFVSTMGAVQTLLKLEDAQRVKLLTHAPPEVEKPAVKKFKLKLKI